MTLTPEQLAEMKAKAEAATPGPWKHGCPVYGDHLILGPAEPRKEDVVINDDSAAKADLAFIAAVNPATVLSLLTEIERLRSGYLADENGNEYVGVCMLKEKIAELTKENERLKEPSGNYRMKCLWEENERLQAELAALKREIETAPVLYGNVGGYGVWSDAVDFSQTHTCRAVRIEEIKK